MKRKLLAAVASVALIASGVAYAQDNANKDRHPEQPQRTEAPAAAQRNEAAPRAAQAEPRREEPRQTETRQPAAAPRNAQNEMRKEEPKTGQNEMRKDEPKAGQMRREEPKTGQTETRQPGATPRNAQGEMRREELRTGPGQMGAHTAQRQGAPRVEGRVNISTEHATRVGEVLRERGGAERVNFNVRVGERVPENIEIRPLPEEVISLVPEYRGYDYFVDSDDEIVFVSPETHEIVGSIDYGDGPVVAGARPCPVEN
jgi:hypothetical protein